MGFVPILTLVEGLVKYLKCLNQALWPRVTKMSIPKKSAISLKGHLELKCFSAPIKSNNKIWWSGDSHDTSIVAIRPAPMKKMEKKTIKTEHVSSL